MSRSTNVESAEVKGTNSWRAWLTEHFSQIVAALVGAIVVWFVFDMSRNPGSLDARLTATSSRLDRIAAALPDMLVKVSTEEVVRPIETAIITTEPVKDAAGNWKAAIHYLDFVKGERTTYVISQKGQDDFTTAYAVKGSAFFPLSPAVSSFQELEIFSEDIGKPTFVPSYVDSSSSFGFYSNRSPEYAKATAELDSFLTKYESVISIKKYPLAVKVTSWEELAAELRDNASDYQLR